MGFFKELKEDFSQAMNELMPVKNYLDDFSEKGNSKDLGEEAEDKKEQADEEIQDQRDLQLKLKEEIQAAINALEIDAIDFEDMEERQNPEALSMEPEAKDEEISKMAEYKRVMLKLSGEALAGDQKQGFDEATCMEVARQVKQLVDDGIEVGIVIGGGNFWRGRNSETIDRTKADQIGMLATVMNCIYVSEIFRHIGMKTQILTPFECGNMTKLFSKDRANKYFEKGMVVFFAGGTGHPYFSTDTGIMLRSIEMDADIILLAKAIDGVYDSDPQRNPDAKKYEEVSIKEVIDKDLRVIDSTAAIMCRDYKMPLLVFALQEENSIVNTINGRFCGTKVTV